MKMATTATSSSFAVARGATATAAAGNRSCAVATRVTRGSSSPAIVRFESTSASKRGAVRCMGTSERRASSGGDGSDGDEKFLGRKGTKRDLSEDDKTTAEARSAVKLDGAFGKPSASKETWQPFQRQARAGLVEAYVEAKDNGESSDLVLNSLYIAQEDDAFKSRTAVCLPIDAYIKRVDKLVVEFMQRDYPKLEAAGTVSTADVIEALEEYLYVQNSYRVPNGWREMYSPYRTYFHNVVAQKVGIPATLAALYIGCVKRLEERGVIPEGVDVLIRPKAPGASSSDAGVTGPTAPWGVVKGSKRPANSVVCTPLMAVKLQLSALKRAYWPWEWDEARDSGVLLAVEAAAYGMDNRMNTAAGVVGIIQPTGRPFGDLAMAVLATERLLQLDGGEGYEQRDLGVLMFHEGKIDEALKNLEAYQAWKESGKADAAPQFVGDVVNLGGQDAVLAAQLQVREDEALAALLLHLRKRALENALDDDGVKSGEV